MSKAAARGVTLVEVLIVVAIMAVIAGGATLLVFPAFKKAKIKSAVVGASAIKQAAELHINVDGGNECPSIQELVTSKKLDAKKTTDPWNSPYKVQCADGEVHVVSPGNDRKEGTPNDIRDDFRDSDVEKVANL